MIPFALTAVLSAVFCWLYLRFARQRDILDEPNDRSSHAKATPHGGGVPMLLAFFVGFVLLSVTGDGWQPGYIAIVIAAFAFMVLGILDDLRGLSVLLRLAVYAGLSLLVAAFLLNSYPAPGIWGLPVLIVIFGAATVWMLNIYNFMDGIDGIASVQALLACIAAACLADDPSGRYPAFCLLLAAAHCGFLVWNWPPARLFMGDAGSIPTGFLLAALALTGWLEGVLNPLCWFVLLALFITDTSFTLLWRLVTGQRITQAHRQHAYQRLGRYWDSHRAVDLLLVGAFLLWLFPLAWIIRKSPENGLFLVILAYLPWVIGMAKIRFIK